jgi:hypothetical protein
VLWILFPRGLLGPAALLVALTALHRILRTLNPEYHVRLLRRRKSLVSFSICVLLTLGAVLFGVFLFRDIVKLSALAPSTSLSEHLWPGLSSYIFSSSFISSLVWFIWSSQGLAGDFKTVRLEGSKKRLHLLRDGAVAGALFGALLYLSVWFLKTCALCLLVFGSRATVSVILLILASFFLSSVSMAFVFGAVFYSFAGTASWAFRGRLALLVPAVAGVLLLSAAAWLSRVDYRRSWVLELAPFVKSPMASNTIILFGEDEHWIGLKDFRYRYWGTEMDLPLTPEAVNWAERYTKASKHGTFLYRGLSIYVESYYEETWDKPSLVAYRLAALEEMSDIVAGSYLLMDMQYGSATSEDLRSLRRLLDGSKYWLNEGVCHRIGNVFAWMGDSAEASAWFARAARHGVNYGYRFPVSGVSNGVICGRLELNGEPLSGVKIGLFRDYSRLRRNVPEPARLHGVHEGLESYLVRTCFPDSEGAYLFDHIVGGAYCIALMADPALIPPSWERVGLENPPPLVVIDPDHRVVDLVGMRITTVP